MRVVYTVFTTVITVFTYEGVYTRTVYTVFTYEGVYTVYTYEGVYTVFTIVFTVFTYEGVYYLRMTEFAHVGFAQMGFAPLCFTPHSAQRVAKRFRNNMLMTLFQAFPPSLRYITVNEVHRWQA